MSDEFFSSKDLAARIKLARERLGMSQEALADACPSLSLSSVQKIERGVQVKGPHALSLSEIARALEVSSDWLLGEDVGSQDAPELSDEDLAIEGVRRDELRDGRTLTDEEVAHLRKAFQASQLSIGSLPSDDAIRDLKIALRRFRAGVAEDYSRPSTPARDRLLGRADRKRGK